MFLLFDIVVDCQRIVLLSNVGNGGDLDLFYHILVRGIVIENSLNISETSRQLYIHRNTLVYRLDKLQKNTGLDIRIFDDAITFKIALMVVKYMKYMETIDY